MSVLDANGVFNRRSYLEWCRRNHPDKFPPERRQEATVVFQELSAAWAAQSRKTVETQPHWSAPSTRETTADLIAAMDTACIAPECYQPRFGSSLHCFYHQPGNMQYTRLFSADITGFEGMSCIDSYRTPGMCAALTKDMHLCRQPRAGTSKFCGTHKFNHRVQVPEGFTRK